MQEITGEPYMTHNYFDADQKMKALYQEYEKKYNDLEDQMEETNQQQQQTQGGRGAGGSPYVYKHRLFYNLTAIGRGNTSTSSPGSQGSGASGSRVLGRRRRRNTIDEYARFYNLPPTPCPNEGLDILQWWHANRSEYPVLSLLARDILTIPGSTVSSEAAFSMAGRMLERRRKSTRSLMVEILMLSRDWIMANKRQQENHMFDQEMTNYFSQIQM